jgi:hypothetical protein
VSDTLFTKKMLSLKDKIENADVLFILGFILVILEWTLIIAWIILGVYVDVLRVMNPTAITLLLEHRLFAFHFVSAIAMMLAAEQYSFRTKLKNRKEHEVDSDWSMTKNMAYLGSWAAAFLTTLFTDIHGTIVILTIPESEEYHLPVLLQTILFYSGALVVLFEIFWSLITCWTIYTLNTEAISNIKKRHTV